MRAPTLAYRGERGRIMLLKRYAEQTGWRPYPFGGGYRSGDGLTHVSWRPGEITVESREKLSAPSVTSTVAVDSVRQAIDILAALDVVPVTFSSSYQMGRDDLFSSFVKRVQAAA